MSIFDQRLAISGGTLHHIGLLMQASDRKAEAIQKHRCAWCDAESGRKPDPSGNESHGICVRHKAGLETQLEQHRRMA